MLLWMAALAWAAAGTALRRRDGMQRLSPDVAVPRCPLFCGCGILVCQKRNAVVAAAFIRV